MPYSFENPKNDENNTNIIGISKVATVSIYDPIKEEYLKLSYKESSIDGTELIHYRQKIDKILKAASISSKQASENNIGRGYKTRTELKKNVGDRYSRFKDTYNHKISRYIFNLALKYNVGLIQMEDLSGFSDNNSESLLKNCSYYDLQ